MTRFEALKAITGVKEFSNQIYDYAIRDGSPERLAEFLEGELTEEGLQLLKTVAQEEDYPISFKETEEDILGFPRVYAVNARYKRLEREAREKNCSVYDLLASSSQRDSFHGTFQTKAELGTGIKAAALQYQARCK